MRYFQSVLQGVLGYPVRNALSAVALALGLFSMMAVVGGSATVQGIVAARALLNAGPAQTFSVNLHPDLNLNEAVRAKEYLDSVLGDDIASTLSLVGVNATLVGVSGGPLGEIVLVDEDRLGVFPYRLEHGEWPAGQNQIRPQYAVNHTAFTAQPEEWLSSLKYLTSERDLLPLAYSGVVSDGHDQPRAYVHLDVLTHLPATRVPEASFVLHITGTNLDREEIREAVSRLESFWNRSVAIEFVRTDQMQQLALERESAVRIFTILISISLIATVISVLNVGLGSVKERSMELSVRRALGWTRARLFAAVILESQIVALLAWFIAVLLCIVGYPWILSLFELPPSVSAFEFPLTLVPVAALAGSFACFLGALAPAIRASGTNLSHVLRT